MNVLATPYVFGTSMFYGRMDPPVPPRVFGRFHDRPKFNGKGSIMERFWQNVSSSLGTKLGRYPTHLDAFKERMRRPSRPDNTRLREATSIAEIVVRSAAIILVIAVCAQALSR